MTESSPIACRTAGCPRNGMPAGYVESETRGAPDEVRGGPCPACEQPTDPEVVTFATWDAPSWATDSKQDGAGIHHSWEHPAQIATLAEIHGRPNEFVQVSAGVEDDIDIDAGSICVTRQTTYIFVESLTMTADAALLLADALRETVARVGKPGPA